MSEKESPYSNSTRALLQTIRKIKERGNEHKVKSPDDFSKLLRKIIASAADEAQSSRCTGEELVSSMSSIAGADRSWRRDYTTLITAYGIAKQERDAILKEKVQIAEIEGSTHRRNVFYRGLTTLVVGLTIMTVYAVAHWLEIPMPLMRIPL